MKHSPPKPGLIAPLVAILALTAGAAQAVPYSVEDKLLASDGAGDDFFGRSVAVFGNTAIFGANGDDDNGFNSGSAYLFDVGTGAQIAKLTANDGAAFADFGNSVAISGNIAIVGANGDDEGGYNSGAAYLFDVSTGAQIAKLTANDAEEIQYFGSSVAISGNTAIVGAHYTDSGAAYLFDVSTGTQIAKLTASDGETGDVFGYSVSISGNTAIVGAYGDDDAGNDTSGDSGSAYLFDITTGAQIAKLTANDAAEGDWFGYSVSISGNTAIVGAMGDDDAGSLSGSAYLFDITTGAQIAKLTANDAAANAVFGESVSISGTTAIVGASGSIISEGHGAAYLFDITTGAQFGKLTASVGEYEYGATYGSRVAISGTTAIVGAYAESDNGVNAGAAYLYTDTSLPAVPLPASAWMLLASFGALAASRRLKARA